MSAQDFKPGDVAMVTFASGQEGLAVYGTSDTGRRFDYCWRFGLGAFEWHDSDNITTARRLVVIDPEDREQVERLARAYWGDMDPDASTMSAFRAALREFANPTPPKPDEPLGHLAVVIDTDGNRWINWRDLRDDMDHERPWVLASDGFTYRDYADINVAEIKWEGIQ